MACCLWSNQTGKVVELSTAWYKLITEANWQPKKYLTTEQALSTIDKVEDIGRKVYKFDQNHNFWKSLPALRKRITAATGEITILDDGSCRVAYEYSYKMWVTDTKGFLADYYVHQLYMEMLTECGGMELNKTYQPREMDAIIEKTKKAFLDGGVGEDDIFYRNFLAMLKQDASYKQRQVGNFSLDVTYQLKF